MTELSAGVSKYDALTATTRSTLPLRANVRRVMVTPPTVTVSNALANPFASLIASAGQKLALVTPGVDASTVATDVFTYLACGNMAQFNTGYPNNYYTRSGHLTNTNIAAGKMVIEFGFDGTQLEIFVKGLPGYEMLLKVDGEYTSLTPLTALPSGDLCRVNVTFATRTTRIITIENGGLPFAGISHGPNDSTWQTKRRGPRAVLVGDSYIEGAQDNSTKGMVTYFRDVMGWPDTIISGIGTTGYLAGGALPTFRTRIINDIINQVPDVVVVAGGHNDTAPTLAALQAEVALFFGQLRAALPKAWIVCTGPMQSDATSIYGPIQAAIFAGATPYADAYIDTCTPTWVTGTGRVGATIGVGNRDLIISNDNTHPSPAGHDYFGRRLAELVSAVLPR